MSAQWEPEPEKVRQRNQAIALGGSDLADALATIVSQYTLSEAEVALILNRAACTYAQRKVNREQKKYWSN